MNTITLTNEEMQVVNGGELTIGVATAGAVVVVKATGATATILACSAGLVCLAAVAGAGWLAYNYFF